MNEFEKPSIENLAPAKKMRRNMQSVRIDFSDPDALDAYQEDCEVSELRGRVTSGYSLKMLTAEY